MRAPGCLRGDLTLRTVIWDRRTASLFDLGPGSSLRRGRDDKIERNTPPPASEFLNAHPIVTRLSRLSLWHDVCGR